MFTPSHRQLDALARMEQYCGIRSHRQQFADATVFQRYWDRVSERCDRLRGQRQRQQQREAQLSPAERAAGQHRRRQRKQQRIAAHYEDRATLLAYAKKYRQRYLPSTHKLRQQLTSKCANAAIVTCVMDEMSAQMDDPGRARQLADGFAAQGHNLRSIRKKLHQRRFASDVIDQALAALTAVTGSSWEPELLAQRIVRLQRQGKSRRSIEQQLCASAADRELFAEVWCGAAADDTDALRRQRDRLQAQGLSDLQLLRRLQAHGFSYADIKQALNAN